jgi:hypothetical protein
VRQPKTPATRDLKIRDEAEKVSKIHLEMRLMNVVQKAMPFLLRYSRHHVQPVPQIETPQRIITTRMILASIVRHKSVGLGSAAILIDLCYRTGPLVGWNPIRNSISKETDSGRAA